MPENADDNVKMEEYNKVVEAHNQLKLEKEKIENEMKELKEQKERESKEEETNTLWEKEKENFSKQIEELNKKLQQTQELVNAKPNPKGIVQEPASTKTVKQMIDEIVPDPQANPERFGSKIQKYGYYKSPRTKYYDNQQLGQILSLHGTATRVNPDLIPPEARKSPTDLNLR